MKKILPFVLLFTCFFGLFGQQLRNEFGNVYYEPNLYKSTYNSSNGSPYLNEEFKPAKINDISETQLVRLDAVLGTVEVLISGNKVVVLDNSKTYLIVFLNKPERIYETHSYIDENGKENTSFFELVESMQHYKLYVKEKKKFFKKVKAQGYSDVQPAMFKNIKSEFYITDLYAKTDLLLYLPYKLKAFTQLFGDDSKLIKYYIKDHKLNLDNANDLAKIFNYYVENLQGQ